ncbi:MAG: hypothetical protein ABIG03_04755 [Candidatus Eisenbacteria bacterium]
MNSRRLIVLSLVLFGALWGLGELGVGELTLARGVPRAPVLTAIGVLFLALTRRIWRAPGSSFALAAVASAFKFLQHPVWGCKIAAVLMVGATFDVGFTLYEGWTARRAATRQARIELFPLGLWALAPVLTFASFVLFGYFARDVLHNPFWASPSRMSDYMFVQGPVAAALAVPAAVAGMLVADRLVSSSRLWGDARWLTYRVVALGSGTACAAAALALRY